MTASPPVRADQLPALALLNNHLGWYAKWRNHNSCHSRSQNSLEDSLGSVEQKKVTADSYMTNGLIPRDSCSLFVGLGSWHSTTELRPHMTLSAKLSPTKDRSQGELSPNLLSQILPGGPKMAKHKNGGSQSLARIPRYGFLIFSLFLSHTVQTPYVLHLTGANRFVQY